MQSQTSPSAAQRLRSFGLKTPSALGSDLKNVLCLLDQSLRVIEAASWEARAVAESAIAQFEGGREDIDALAEEARAQAERFVRLGKTGGMLGQVVATYRLFGLSAPFLTQKQSSAKLHGLHEKNAHRFYRTSVEQGGAFLKVGQLLSSRGDLLPEPWIEELSKLQDEAPTLCLDTVRAVIEEDLGQSVDELFASFEPEPIGSASIGQVHHAVTHEGVAVAVKVQRPGIEALLELDMGLLELFTEAMRSSWPDVDYEVIVGETRRAILSEVDYVNEGEVTEEVAQYIDTLSGVTVPHRVEQLSRGRVLSTTFIEGRKISHVLDELRALADAGDEGAQARLSTILGRLLHAYLRQILLLGLFQADPHPGNLLVTAEDEVVILDFGCSQRMAPETRDRYRSIMFAAMVGDRAKIAEELFSLGFATASGEPDTLTHFADAMLEQLMAMNEGPAIEWPDKDALMEKATGLMQAYERDPVIALPPEFIMMGRVFATLGGLFSHYRPDIDVARYILPALSSDPVTSVAVAV